MPLAHNHLDILPKSPKISFLLYGSNLRWSHFNQKTCQIWPFSPAGIQIDGTLSSSFSPVPTNKGQARGYGRITHFLPLPTWGHDFP